MSKLRLVLMVVIFYVARSCCNFSEIVNFDEILGNSTLLPTFDDQIDDQLGSGKYASVALK